MQEWEREKIRREEHLEAELREEHRNGLAASAGRRKMQEERLQKEATEANIQATRKAAAVKADLEARKLSAEVELQSKRDECRISLQRIQEKADADLNNKMREREEELDAVYKSIDAHKQKWAEEKAAAKEKVEIELAARREDLKGELADARKAEEDARLLRVKEADSEREKQVNIWETERGQRQAALEKMETDRTTLLNERKQGEQEHVNRLSKAEEDSSARIRAASKTETDAAKKALVKELDDLKLQYQTDLAKLAKAHHEEESENLQARLIKEEKAFRQSLDATRKAESDAAATRKKDLEEELEIRKAAAVEKMQEDESESKKERERKDAEAKSARERAAADSKREIQQEERLAKQRLNDIEGSIKEALAGVGQRARTIIEQSLTKLREERQPQLRQEQQWLDNVIAQYCKVKMEYEGVEGSLESRVDTLESTVEQQTLELETLNTNSISSDVLAQLFARVDDDTANIAEYCTDLFRNTKSKLFELGNRISTLGFELSDQRTDHRKLDRRVGDVARNYLTVEAYEDLQSDPVPLEVGKTPADLAAARAARPQTVVTSLSQHLRDIARQRQARERLEALGKSQIEIERELPVVAEYSYKSVTGDMLINIMKEYPSFRTLQDWGKTLNDHHKMLRQIARQTNMQEPLPIFLQGPEGAQQPSPASSVVDNDELMDIDEDQVDNAEPRLPSPIQQQAEEASERASSETDGSSAPSDEGEDSEDEAEAMQTDELPADTQTLPKKPSRKRTRSAESDIPVREPELAAVRRSTRSREKAATPAADVPPVHDSILRLGIAVEAAKQDKRKLKTIEKELMAVNQVIEFDYADARAICEILRVPGSASTPAPWTRASTLLRKDAKELAGSLSSIGKALGLRENDKTLCSEVRRQYN